MKKILFILLAITGCMFTSCENQDWEFPDYEYTSVYFAYQTPIRTITFGEDYVDTSLDNQGQCEIMATMGGVYSNDANRTISITIDNSIVDAVKFEDGSEIKAMPSEYYSLSANQIVIPKGKMLGGVTVQLTDAFFADPDALTGKYVIPVRMTGVQGADTILEGKPIVENPRLAVAEDWDVAPKNYVLYAIKYINQYDGWYLRTGTDVYSDARGTVERKWDYIEKAEEVKNFSTISKDKLRWAFDLKDAEGIARECDLQLAFDASGAVSISSLTDGITASGSGQYTPLGEKNSFGGKDRDVMNLNYTINWPAQPYYIVSPNLGGVAAWNPAVFTSTNTGDNYHLALVNEAEPGQNWSVQAWIELPEVLEKGAQYTLSCKAKASAAYGCSVFPQSADGSQQQYDVYLSIGTEWSPLSSTFTAQNDAYTKLTFNFGDFQGTIEVDDVVLTKAGSDVNLIANGTFENREEKFYPSGSVQVTDKLVLQARGVKSEWFKVIAK